MLPDPGFEKMDFCPGKGGKKESTLKALECWWSANKCSPDYMNRCAGGMDGIINNVGGTQDPAEGNGYAGICHGRRGKYFESIQTRLVRPLEKDSLYIIRFKVSFGDKVFYATNEFGFYFGKYKEIGKSKMPSRLGYVPVRTGSFHTSKKDWMELSAYYLAEGGEEYFTLGFMNPYPELQLVGGKEPKAIDGEADDVYYFLDDVSVELHTGKISGSYTVSPLSVKRSAQWELLKGVEYRPNEYIPLPGSFKRLDSLAALFLGDTSVTMCLSMPGQVMASNLWYLQRSRNDFLRNYFIAKGIDPVRIKEKGDALQPVDVFRFRWE